MDQKKKDKKKIKQFKEFDPAEYIELEPKLTEALKKDAVVTSFGRMNPITVGHEKLADKIASEARSRKADATLFLSHSQDAKKNPLSYDQKYDFAKKAFGPMVKKSKARSIIEVAKVLQNQYKNLIVVVGSDRVKEFETLLNKYNGKDYKFESIEVVSAGSRDPDAEGVEGMSASKMRQLAMDGDFEEFKKGLPKRLQGSAQKVYDAIRDGMQLDEALTRAQRRKRSMQMRRMKGRMKRGRAKAARKRASLDKLKSRAKKQAIGKMKQKLAKGKRFADLDFASRERIEKRLKKMPKNRLDRLARKLLPSVKQREKQKFQKKNESTQINEFLPAIGAVAGAAARFAAKTVAKQFTKKALKKKAVSGAAGTAAFPARKAEARQPQDPDIKDMPGSQPSGYYKGVDKDKKDDRARHFARKAKMDDDNPKAYTPAPGDKEAKTKPSKYTKKFAKMFGEKNPEEPKPPKKRPHMLLAKNGSVKIDKRFKMFKKGMSESVFDEVQDLAESVENLIESPLKSVRKKAEKAGIPYAIAKDVFDRGVAAWRTGHRPGTTPAQWGLARLNSFATGGKTTKTADKDLHDKWKGKKEETDLTEKLKVSDGLGAWIKDFQDSDAPQFKNADSKKRRDMAIAAFTDAGGKLDETLNEKAEKFLADRKNKKEPLEWGTDEMTKAYKKGTPGQ